MLGFGVTVRFFCQAEDGIRDLVRSRGLGDVYKRQVHEAHEQREPAVHREPRGDPERELPRVRDRAHCRCLLYTSDAADERSSVDLGGRRIIKKKKKAVCDSRRSSEQRHNRNI